MQQYTIAYYGHFGEHNTESYIAYALENMGHSVIKLPPDSMDLPECDFRLFARIHGYYVINNSKEPTVCWIFDLYRNLIPSPIFEGRTTQEPQFSADIVITTDGGDNYHTVRQGVHRPHKIMYSADKIYDTIFVGNPYSYYRRDIIKRLKLKLVENTRGLELNKLLAQTKIVVGDSVPADYYWSNRVYEITGRGGFLIHPKTKGLPDYIPQYERGREKKVIDHFLKCEDERETLRQIQFIECPTYHDRVFELLQIIKEIK